MNLGPSCFGRGGLWCFGMTLLANIYVQSVEIGVNRFLLLQQLRQTDPELMHVFQVLLPGLSQLPYLSISLPLLTLSERRACLAGTSSPSRISWARPCLVLGNPKVHLPRSTPMAEYADKPLVLYVCSSWIGNRCLVRRRECVPSMEGRLGGLQGCG